MDRADDLAAVDALKVDAGDAEVRNVGYAGDMAAPPEIPRWTLRRV
jgi:hypothetical protein